MTRNFQPGDVAMVTALNRIVSSHSEVDLNGRFTDWMTGLGAVVEDATGERWTRIDREGTPWARGYAFPQRWRDLDVVRVLSEGVTP